MDKSNKEFINNLEGKPDVLLTQEEIDFFREFSLKGGARIAQAVANLLDFPHLNISDSPERQSEVRKRRDNLTIEQKSKLPQNSELGGFEFKTAKIVAQQWQKILDAGVKEGLFKNADLTVNVIQNTEHKMLSLAEYKKLLDGGIDGLKMIGVIASIDGDNENGPAVLMRSDMDALQMSTSEVKHQCGHNIHTGWSVMNMKSLSEYKKKFGVLPFKKVVFVSESNEEANFSAGEHIAPFEMMKSGFFERFGKFDLALGQHAIASIPENEIRIDSGFPGATDVVNTLNVTEKYDQHEDNDPKLIPFEVARLVNEEFHSDDPNDKFGKMQLVEDLYDKPVAPDVYIRMTAIKEKKDGKFENLAINSIPEKSTVSVYIERGSNLEEKLNNYLNLVMAKWTKFGFDIKAGYKIDESNKLDIFISMGHTGHVAMGGPNPTQIMGDVLNFVRQSSKMRAIEPVTGIKFGGTMRIKGEQYKNLLKSSSEKMRKILVQAIKNLGLEEKIKSDINFQNGISPTINNGRLITESRAVVEKAGVTLNKFQLPNAGAETFGTFQDFLKDPEANNMLYVLIGGMDEKLAEELKATGKSLPPIAIHHSEEFKVKDTALPYGIILSSLLIEFSKRFSK